MRSNQHVLPSAFPSCAPAAPAAPARDQVAIAAVGADTRRWVALAIASLVIAGLLSLAVVLGRLPVLSRIIDDPLFFKRCLVVHVVLALIVWFYAFLAGLISLRTGGHSPGIVSRLSHGLAVGGVLLMLGGALMRGSQPVLANYVPVIDHPLFLAGLAAFFGGIVIAYVRVLARTAAGVPSALDGSTHLPSATATGLLAAATAVVLAFATWVSTEAGLPGGLDRWTRFEFSAWGAGHVLQVANAAAMVAVWLWLLERATGHAVLTTRTARWCFTLLIAPHFAMPLLTWRGSLDALYHTGATTLMRWGIFPVVVVLLGLSLRHLWRHRAGAASRDGGARLALTGFGASAALTALGFILGACIRGSTTLVPAHYHAALGAVTAAFMTAAFLVADAVSRGDGSGGLTVRTWRSAKRQILVFGVGQTVFALGFAIGGVYGLGRKTYAAEQHARSVGEITGLIVMGVGGLIAVVGGLWFLSLILREMRAWWRRRDTLPSTTPTP